MILHLAESKQAWVRAAVARTAGGGGGIGGDGSSILAVGSSAAWQPAGGLIPYPAAGLWAIEPYTRGVPGTHACYDVANLGAFLADAVLAHVAVVAARETRYARHRPVSAKAAAALVYYSRNRSSDGHVPALTVRSCAAGASRADDNNGGGGGLDAAGEVVAARRAFAELASRYDAYTAAERRRTLAWLCAWARISDAYMLSVRGLDLDSRIARRLPEVGGNRRVRTPMYGGERLGWWRQTVNTSAGVGAGGACEPPTDECPPPKRGRLRPNGRAGRRHGRRAHGRKLAARSRDVSALPGRSLRAKRASRYDLDTSPVPGTPCMPPLPADANVGELRERLFAGYLQLQHARHAEYGRTQRWMCSWLYKLRACDDAERAQRTQPVPLGQGRCRLIGPPDHSAIESSLGWRGHKVNAMADLAPLLFAFRCW